MIFGNKLNVLMAPEGDGGGSGGAGGANGSAGTGQGSGAGGSGGAGAASGAAAGAPADWMTGFSDDEKGFIQNKGFKGAKDMLMSYRNIESLMGVPEQNMLKLPAKEDDAEGWGKVYGRLGRPEKPADYKLALPDGADAKFADAMKGVFHEAGLTAKQAEKLSTKYNEYIGQALSAQQQASNEANATKARDAETALRKEWGMAYDQNMRLIDNAALQLGITNEHSVALHKVMGPVEALKFVHGLATKLGGESSFVRGDGGGNTFNGGALSPVAAQNKIAQLQGDKGFMERYLTGDIAAKEEFTNLFKMAYPEQSA